MNEDKQTAPSEEKIELPATHAQGSGEEGAGPTPPPRTDHLHGGNWRTSRKLRHKEHKDLWHRLNTKMIAVRVAIVTTVLFLLTAGLTLWLHDQMLRAEETYSLDLSEAAQLNSLLQADKEKAQSEIADLKEERDQLQSQLISMENELKAVKTERDELMENDKVISSLNQTIGELRAQISSLNAQIAALEDKLLREEDLDLSRLLAKMQLLDSLLKTGAPLQTVSVEMTDEYGNPYLVTEQVYPNLSFYIADSKNGFAYRFENGKVYDTGELKHLIYALAILECAAEEQASLNGQGTPNGLRYDLTETYTLKKEDIVSGSGILKNEAPGKVYTYLELIEIMLSWCDVTAYGRLVERFGDEPLALLLANLPELSSAESFDRLTAADLMLILKRVNAMIEGNSPYAERLKLALTSAVATQYSQSVSGTIGRQYTRIASGYHELGIRFQGEDELMVVLLSDVAVVDAAWNSYLSELYRVADDLMQGFR